MRIEPMQKLVVVRHAAATGQDANAALTLEGQRQAHLLADFLQQFQIQRVISSPFVRAIESIQPFCSVANIRVETDDRLIERVLSARNLPDWREHLQRSFDDLDYCLEDGESSRTAQARGTAVLRAALASRASCVVVTHGNLLALILKSIDASVGFDFWSKLSNPDVFVVHVDHDQATGFHRVWN